MSAPDGAIRWIIRLYLAVFLLYLLFPLAYMLLVAFNASRIPTHRDFSFTANWFAVAWQDQRMWHGLRVSLLIGVVVVILSVVLGLAGAFMLVRLELRAKSLL